MRTLALVAAVLSGTLLASPSAFAQQAPAADQTSPTASAVWVHIDGSEDATLQRDDGDRWRNVCKAPCNQAVSAAPRYRIAGDGLQNSKPFALRGERETLHVDESPEGVFVAGIVATVTGGLSLNVGLMVYFLSSFDQNQTTARTGLTIVGLSVAALVGGIVAIATNAHSGVTQGPESSPAARIQTQDVSRDAAWAPRATEVSIPLVSGRF
jgi:hypothetical protein